MTKQPSGNYSEQELENFEQIAGGWWDPEGKFKPLHLINPLRANYIDEMCPVAGKSLLDIGCGGGLLSEAMAQRGAKVCGIDRGEKAVKVAREHAEQSDLKIEYRQCGSEDMLKEHAGKFDIVCCLELLEHVPDPAQMVDDCKRLLKPGGSVFFSTINRNPVSWLMAIVGAEYVLQWLPRAPTITAN